MIDGCIQDKVATIINTCTSIATTPFFIFPMMDLLSYLQTISGFLALLFLLYVVLGLTTGPKPNKGSTKQLAPEPSGALPLIGHLHLLGGQNPVCRTFAAMAEKHGSIFSLRIGFYQTLVVSSREIAKECLVTKDRVFATRPNIAAGRYIGYNNALFALAPYGPYWRDLRKIATIELLSSYRLEKLKHVRDLEIFSLVKDLYLNCIAAEEKPIALTKSIEHLTFNIIVRMIAGKRFSGEIFWKEENEAWRLKKAIQDATYLSGVFVEADAFPSSFGWIDFQGYLGLMKRTAKEIDYVLDKWLGEHLEKMAEKENCESDIMDVLISNFAHEAVISGHKREIVIKATALTLILTGSGSTAITLSWALSLLLNHPKVLQAAQQELDTHVGNHKWVQESDIKDLKYLQAIIKETFRLYPPAPLTGIREAMEDCTVSGYHVPKGTRLLINIWMLHRDPQVWSNPDEFQPERFMNEHENLDYRGQNLEYIPFSSGRRSCPAMMFGTQVVHLTLARLIQGFEMSTVAGAPVDMSEGLGVAMPKLNPVEVLLKPRLPLELYQGL